MESTLDGALARGATAPGPRGGPGTVFKALAAVPEVMAWFRRTRAFPYPSYVAGSAMALLFLVGGVTTLVTLALPHPETLDQRVMGVIGSTSPFAALVIHALRYRLPSAVYPVLLVVGTGIVTTLVATAGSTSASVTFSFFYMWIVIYALLFFSPVGVLFQVVLVAAAYGSAVAWTAEAGASAFSAFEAVVLVSVIGTTSGIITLLSRARETSEIDPLTRIPNRRGLDRLLTAAVQEAPRAGQDLVVAMIDVDHFKSINDENGHAAGDRVLEDLTRAWRAVLRPGDALCRIGGDEFLVILPGCSLSDASGILERLRTAAPGGVTCSIGGAYWQHGDSASMLVSHADTALYQAKRLGRNQVAWSTIV